MNPGDYTKEQREALSTAFKAAKNVLTMYGVSRFICTALSNRYIYSFINCWQVNEAKRIIRVRMGHQHTLEDWLKKHHKVPKAQLTHAAMYQYRLAWLDSLIKEFSS